MRLENVLIRFPGLLVDNEIAIGLEEKTQKIALLPELFGRELSDDEIIRQLVAQFMPLVISAKSSPVTFEAQFARFPYSINGQEEFETFSIRLIPDGGPIIIAPYEDNRKINLTFESIDQEKIYLESGNGTLRLEIYLAMPTERLPHLVPSEEYQRHRMTSGAE